LFILGSFLAENTEEARIFGRLFSTMKVLHLFRRKMGWATFWAIFFTNPSGHCQCHFKNRKQRMTLQLEGTTLAKRQ
jgi:hypothetical protein